MRKRFMLVCLSVSTGDDYREDQSIFARPLASCVVRAAIGTEYVL